MRYENRLLDSMSRLGQIETKYGNLLLRGKRRKLEEGKEEGREVLKWKKRKDR
jgi:hypothetical protein